MNASTDGEQSLYVRDQYGRTIQRETGNLSTSFRYVQLFINGLYWGLYDLSERPDEAFVADHLGVDVKDIDLIRGGSPSDDNSIKYYVGAGTDRLG